MALSEAPEAARIAQGLTLGLDGVDGGLLGLDHSHRATMAICENVVGPGAVTQGVLEVDAAPIRKVPAHVRELGVDLDPRKGFTPLSSWAEG